MDNNFDLEELFAKNDKYLKVVNILLIVITALIIVGSLCGGIVIIVRISAAGLGLLLGGIIFAIIIFIFGKLILSFLFDVKLIRNKVYGTDIGQLADFYIGNNTIEPTYEEISEETNTED